MFKQFCCNESGATTIEYGLVAAIISIVGITVMRYVGSEISMTFEVAGTEMGSTRPGAPVSP